MDCYQQVLDTLSRCKRVLLTTHVKPDGDALGSTAAMALALKSKGIVATALLLSHLPKKYAFVYVDSGVLYFDVEKGWPEEGRGLGVLAERLTTGVAADS